MAVNHMVMSLILTDRLFQFLFIFYFLFICFCFLYFPFDMFFLSYFIFLFICFSFLYFPFDMFFFNYVIFSFLFVFLLAFSTFHEFLFFSFFKKKSLQYLSITVHTRHHLHTVSELGISVNIASE